jgi:hypothetical protein
MPTVVVEPVAPPPVPARSAPRPLRDVTDDRLRTNGDELEAQEDEVAEGLEPDGVGWAAGEGSADQRETHDVAEGATFPGDDAGTPPGTDDGREVVGEVDEPSFADPIAVLRPEEWAVGASTGVDSDSSPEAEDHEVVVIDAYGLESDAGSQPEVEGNGAPVEAESDEGRKRWSLFRRGGKR